MFTLIMFKGRTPKNIYIYFRREDCQLCRKMTEARNPSVHSWRAQTDTWPRHCETLTGVVILVLHTIIPTRVSHSNLFKSV